MLRVDLPMPEACDVCPFNYDFCWCKAFENDEDWKKYSDDWNDHVCDREDRPEYCPLKEIIRCKDCVHHDDDFPCELHTIDGSAHDDWFCADGMKK